MTKGTKDIIFEKHFLDLMSSDNVRLECKLDKLQFTQLTKEIAKERKIEILEMQRIRQLFNNKKKNRQAFKFSDKFSDFYKWYINQYRKQEGKCYYCKTEEKVIAILFEKKYFHRKRLSRGKHLEIERRDSKNNEYSPENCVLACYFCNNDKSDIFDEKEYIEYLKNRRLFFENQYKMLK